MFQLLAIIPYMERFGAGMLLTLVRAAVRVVCALERASLCRWNTAARCWCRVLLAVRVVCTVWSDAGGAQGAAAGAA